jgi:AcrR family transcriptional regulator
MFSIYFRKKVLKVRKNMENRNVRKSKKAIQKAFAELLSEKNDINKITVKELVERADISKSTFYSHYQDIYSVKEEFEDEIISLLNSLLEDYLKSHTLDYPTYIKKLIELLKKNEDLYKKIFLSDLPSKFINNLKDKCNDVISKDVHLNFLSEDNNKRKAEIDFITNGTIHLFVDYFKGKIPQTLDEIGEGIINVINRISLIS